MIAPRSLLRRAAPLFGAAIVVLGGCSSGDDDAGTGDAGVEAIPPAEAAEEVTRSLFDATGSEPDSVSCPEGVATETGATSRCELIDGAQTFGITVTVLGRSDGEVTLDVAVDPEPVG